MEVKLEKKLPN